MTQRAAAFVVGLAFAAGAAAQSVLFVNSAAEPGGDGLAPCPAADYYFYFTVSNEVFRGQPSTTITLWAAFDPRWYAFGLSRTEVLSATDPGWFSSPRAILEQEEYCDPGDVSPDGDSVLGIRLQQFQEMLGEFADYSNPIDLWSVTWTTDEFAPRTVPIETHSKDFWIYLDNMGTGQNFYGDDFAEGQALVRVVGCYPDFTDDGDLDLFDFLAFVNLFNAEDPTADCTADQSLDLFDFLCFVSAFNAGCG